VRSIKALFASIILFTCSALPGGAGPLEDAEKELFHNREEAALRLLRPLADQGNAQAQYLIGTLYFKGWGVPQDDTVALKWFRLSADQGSHNGLGALGSMYFMGRGVPQDYVLAHMYFNLSAARGGSAERRDSVLQLMTPTQIAEAQKMAREWKPGTH
jgi:uncharacterized protein